MVDKGDIDLARYCLEAFYRNNQQVSPRVPEEMKTGTWEDDGWSHWQLIPSRVSEADVAAIEDMLPFSLPPLFRAILVSYFALDMTIGEFSLPEMPSDDPLSEVKAYLIRPTLWAIGYAPFAGNVEGDPVCFDLRADAPNGDYEIVVINHDMIVPYENWAHRELVEPHAKRLARSFRDFFITLCLGEQASTSR
ncbi:MAG: SMI1/KNR4 family protein [Gemmataceae bacterium]